MDAPEHWGTTSAERARRTPADDLVAHPTDRWTRGATSTADPATLYRWLCQLTVAPYSYDLVDNWSWSSSAPLRLPRARRSPRTLTPGAEQLTVGQRLLMIFVVDSFVPGEHLTIRRRRRSGPVGEFAVTYAVHPHDDGSRLTATVVVDGTAPVVGKALAWGDLVMMRRQLTLLCALAAG